MSMKNFDVGNFSVLVTGYMYNQVPITFWGTGDDVFQWERRQPGITDVMSVDGQMAISTSRDNSLKVIIKLNQLSPDNAVFSRMFATQQTRGLNAAIFLSFQDLMRQDLGATGPGYIENHAPIKRGGKTVETEWTLIFSTGGQELGDPSFASTPAAVAELLGA